MEQKLGLVVIPFIKFMDIETQVNLLKYRTKRVAAEAERQGKNLPDLSN